MSHSSPLAQPEPWNLVAEGYVIETAPLLSHYARDAIELARLAPGERVLREPRPAGEWNELSRAVLARLEDRFGPGPVHVEWPANLGIGWR